MNTMPSALKRNLITVIEPAIVVWRILRSKRRRQLALLIPLSTVSAFGDVASLGALIPFLNSLSSVGGTTNAVNIPQFARTLPTYTILPILAAIFILLSLLSTLLRLYTVFYQLKLAALITADIGNSTFESIVHKPYLWQLQKSSSKIIGCLTKDVDQLSATIQSFLLLIINIVLVVILGTWLLIQAPLLISAICIALITIYSIMFSVTRSTLRRKGGDLTSSYQSSIKIIQETFGGIRIVIISQLQNIFLALYSEENKKYREASASINAIAQYPRYIIEASVVILIMISILIMTLAGSSFSNHIPVFGILALGAYKLLQPLQQCFAAIATIQANKASLNNVNIMLSKEITISNSVQITHAAVLNFRQPDSDAQLQLQNVHFSYDCDQNFVIKNVNLSIFKGDRIAIVGPSGGGKSTLSDIFLGLLKPTMGQVLSYGIDIHQDPQSILQWYNKISAIPQHIYLSDATIKENIAYGIPKNLINLDIIRMSASVAKIDQFIEQLPDKYDASVGERGINLSGGQRQRIGIARALYKRSELIIFDEATSALDNQTEIDVMQKINSLSNDITLIIIAHRLGTIRHCKNIIFMENGAVSGIGSYEHLYSINQGFRQLTTTIK